MHEIKTDNLSEAFVAGLEGAENSEVYTRSLEEIPTPANGISFYIIRLAKMVTICGSGNFFIGRTADENPSRPMLNLENLDGLGTTSSVSRRHALICPLGTGYEVIDLFSKNGTWLGGHHLTPNKAYPLVSGDLLKVGQERLLVRFHSS